MTEAAAIVPVEVKPVGLSLGALDVEGPQQMVERASAIATTLASVIDEQKLFKQIGKKKHVFVEGWTTLGAMLGVIPVEEYCIRLEDGSYEAAVKLLRIHDQKMVGRASALCGMDERGASGNNWSKSPEYARRSMAVTRATGKAFRLSFSWIMSLAGYSPTPAEEMPSGDDETDIHWTQQDLGRFWGYVKSELDLTEAEVHEALGVEHIKDFKGDKRDAMEKLEEAAEDKRSAASDSNEEESAAPTNGTAKRPYSPQEFKDKWHGALPDLIGKHQGPIETKLSTKLKEQLRGFFTDEDNPDQVVANVLMWIVGREFTPTTHVDRLNLAEAKLMESILKDGHAMSEIRAIAKIGEGEQEELPEPVTEP